jgi:hypothetical protein
MNISPEHTIALVLLVISAVTLPWIDVKINGRLDDEED